MTENSTELRTVAQDDSQTDLTHKSSSMDYIIRDAIHKGIDVNALEKLLSMKEKMEAELARKSFIHAMSRFKALCPIIKKSRKVSFNATKYNYASLEDIFEQTKEALFDCGLTYQFAQEQTDKALTVTCVVSHVDGHSEKCAMSAGADKSGSKNDIQALGSALTYLKRYALLGALGIAVADEDTDGIPSKVKEEVYDEKKIITVENLLTSIDKTFEDFQKVIKGVIGRQESEIGNLSVNDCDKIISYLKKKGAK